MRKNESKNTVGASALSPAAGARSGGNKVAPAPTSATAAEKLSSAMASATIRNTAIYWSNCKKLGLLYFILEIPTQLYGVYTPDPEVYKICRYINYFLLALYSSSGSAFLIKYCLPMLTNVRKKARQAFKLRYVRAER